MRPQRPLLVCVATVGAHVLGSVDPAVGGPQPNRLLANGYWEWRIVEVVAGSGGGLGGGRARCYTCVATVGAHVLGEKIPAAGGPQPSRLLANGYWDEAAVPMVFIFRLLFFIRLSTCRA